MNRITKSTALLASVLFATLSVQAGVPFNNLQGVGGAAFNPLAYTAGQNAGTNNPGAILSKPQAGAWFTRLGDKNINWEAFGVAETIGKRLELSYGYEAIRLGGENAKNISKHNVGAKVLAIQENEFGSFVPAVSVGAIWKTTDANLFGQHNSGLDSYIVATKLITQTPVPVLVSAGLLYTAEEVTGAVGFNKDHDLTYFGNIDVIPVSCLAVGAEYKQGARFENGFKNANYWDALGNVPGLGNVAFILKVRVTLLRDIGAALSPFNAHQFLLGLETLPLRQRRHSENALAVAAWLAKNPRAKWVTYPGLKDDVNHAVAAKYLKNGFGGLVGFGIQGGLAAGRRFIDSVKLLSHLANIGDSKSLVIHPASTTHQQLTPAEQQETGVTEDYIRLSVGLEDVEDILADIDQALKAATT